MAGCGTCGACGADHSSKAPQSPSLVNLEVVRSIFTQAIINMMRRHISNAQGELDTEKMLEKDEYLAQWIGDTFTGKNPHFETGPEDWNSSGLAQYMRENLAHLTEAKDLLTDDDEEVVYNISALFKEQAQAAISSFLADGNFSTYPEELPPYAAQFIEAWAMLYTGAPL